MDAKTVIIPAGPVRLPDAGHFFEATTVFFGSKPAISVNCDFREQAEVLSVLAATGLVGAVPLPTTPEGCRSRAPL